MGHGGLTVSQAEFSANLDTKAGDEEFREDILPLLPPDLAFHHDEALVMVRERLVERL